MKALTRPLNKKAYFMTVINYTCDYRSLQD